MKIIPVESAERPTMAYMLDTNCFDRILDGNLSLRIPTGVTLICTGVQRDELDRSYPPDRRDALLKIFSDTAPRIALASSFCFDIEGAGFGQARWNDGTGCFDQMLARLIELDSQNKKKPKDSRNQIRDIVNAETALKGGLVLVTADENLVQVIIEFGGTALRFPDFIAQISLS